MATGLKEVALIAGVSVQTASDILNCGRHDRYNPNTQARVKEVAQEQRYRPQRLGRVLRAQSTGMIGFVTANFSRGWPVGVLQRLSVPRGNESSPQRA